MPIEIRSRRTFSRALAATYLGLVWLLASPALAAPPRGSETSPPAGPVRSPAPEGPRPSDAPIDELEDYEDPVSAALAPQPGGLTADQVAARAAATGPTIERAQAELELAAARVDESRFGYTPRLGLEASYTRVSRAPVDFDTGGFSVGALNEGVLTTGPCPGNPGAQCVIDAGGIPVAAQDVSIINDPPLNFFDFTASLGIPIVDYFTAVMPSVKANRLAVDGATYARDAERLTVEVDARTAYYNWLRTQAQVAVAEASLARSESRLADTEAGFRAGINSKADVMRLDALVARTESALIESRAAERVARRNLAVLMGEGSAERLPYQVGEDVLEIEARTGDLGTLPELIASAHADRLELKAVGANRAAAEQSLQAIRASYYPSVIAFGEAKMANPNQRFFPLRNEWNGSWAAGVRLQWFLDGALLAKPRVDQQRAQVRSIQAEGENLRRLVTLQVTQAYEDRARAIGSVDTNRRATQAAAEGYRVATMLYRVGNATTTDIIEAELEQTNASLADVNNRISVHEATVRLMYASGRLSPTRGGSSPPASSAQ